MFLLACVRVLCAIDWSLPDRLMPNQPNHAHNPPQHHRMENAFPPSSSSSNTNKEGEEKECAKPFVDVPGAVEAWKGEGGYVTCVRGGMLVVHVYLLSAAMYVT